MYLKGSQKELGVCFPFSNDTLLDGGAELHHRLFTSLAESLLRRICTQEGSSHLLFPRCECPRSAKCKENLCSSFFVWLFISCKRDMSVKVGALSALESFKKSKMFLMRVFLHSLCQSCRMQMLRLASKSWRSCFGREVSSYFLSELGNTFNFKIEILLFLAFFKLLLLYYTHSWVCQSTHALLHLSLPSIFFPHALCSTYCYYGMLLSLYVCRMALSHSFGPRPTVTPQLCGSCWRRALIRRRRIR